MTVEQHRQAAESCGEMSRRLIRSAKLFKPTWVDMIAFWATLAAHHGALALWLGDGKSPTPKDD